MTYVALCLSAGGSVVHEGRLFHDCSVFILWTVVFMFLLFLPQAFVKDIVYHRTLHCWY